MAEYPQKTSLKVQMRGIHFGSQITHLEESTKTNHPLNRTLVWRCKKCAGQWRARIANRTKANPTGCPKCAEAARSNKKSKLGVLRAGRLSETHPGIAKEWDQEKNGALSATEVSPNSGIAVWWKCKRGHSWIVRIISRTARGGTSCPYCSGQTSQIELRFLSELQALFKNVIWRQKIKGCEIDLMIPNQKVAVEIDGYPWHLKKLDRDKKKAQLIPEYSLIHIRDSRLEKISETDIAFTDKEPHISVICRFLKAILKSLSPGSRIHQNVCNYIQASKYIAEPNYKKLLTLLPGPLEGRSLADLFPTLVREWNIPRNNPLTPSDVYPRSNLKVWWVCINRHEWPATISNRSYGRGCPICEKSRKGANTRKYAIKKKGSLKETHKAIAAEWHIKNLEGAEKYSGGSSHKAWWICKDGHEWQTSIAARTRKNSGCPICSYGGIRNSEEYWDARFSKIVSYYKLNGHVRLSRRNAEEKQLVDWLQTQRRRYREGKLLQPRIAKLTSIPNLLSARKTPPL